jgi:hypothetical protein
MIYMAIGLGFFAACAALTRLCESLLRPQVRSQDRM